MSPKKQHKKASTDAADAGQNTTTALALHDDSIILRTWVSGQNEAARCAVCCKDLTGETYFACNNPVLDPTGSARHAQPAEHFGHTVCKVCVETEAYIGDKGKCAACIKVLNLQPGAKRGVGAKAGVALQPAVRNTLCDKMISALRSAQREMAEAKERVEMQEVQEGERRRAIAVEGVRQKRDERRGEIELELIRQAMQEEAEAAANEKAERQRAELEEERKNLEAQKRKDEQAAEKERKKLEQAAEKERKQLQEKQQKAQEEKERALNEAKEAQEALDKLRKQTPANSPKTTASSSNSACKKRKRMDPQKLDERRKKAKETRERNKANKEKLAGYDKMVDSLDTARDKLDRFMAAASEFVEQNGLNKDEFEEFMEAALAEEKEVEYADDEGEEEDEEEQEED